MRGCGDGGGLRDGNETEKKEGQDGDGRGEGSIIKYFIEVCAKRRVQKKAH